MSRSRVRSTAIACQFYAAEAVLSALLLEHRNEDTMAKDTIVHELFRIDDAACGYIALDLSDEPCLIAEIDELQEEGESEAEARERLAAAPAARVGSGSAASEYGEHAAFIAVDPRTRRGCFALYYGHGGEDMRVVENVKTLRSELRRTLRAGAADLIDLCDGFEDSEIDITIDVPSELPRLRARK